MEEKKEYSKETHNQIIGWTENCDTKASIILAFTGVIISVIFVSEYVLNSFEKLLRDVFNYWETSIGGFDFLAFFIFIAFIISAFFIGKSVVKLIKVLTSKLDNGKEKIDSIIFFKSIGNLSREEYLDKVNNIEPDELINDRLEQIHICSKICSAKFMNYNKGIFNLKMGVLFLCLFLLLIVIYNS